MKIIHPNARNLLTDSDSQFVEETLATCGESRDSLHNLIQHRDMLDLVLDNGKLLDAVLAGRGKGNVSIRLFYYLAVRYELRHVGIEDREIADYMAEFLLQYVPEPRVGILLSGGAFDYRYVMGMEQTFDGANEEQRFILHSRIANYSLMICALCPERVTKHLIPGVPEANDPEYYAQLSLTHFKLALMHRLSWEHELDTVYGNIVANWTGVRSALSDLARQFLLVDKVSESQPMTPAS